MPPPQQLDISRGGGQRRARPSSARSDETLAYFYLGQPGASLTTTPRPTGPPRPRAREPAARRPPTRRQRRAGSGARRALRGPPRPSGQGGDRFTFRHSTAPGMGTQHKKPTTAGSSADTGHSFTHFVRGEHGTPSLPEQGSDVPSLANRHSRALPHAPPRRSTPPLARPQRPWASRGATGCTHVLTRPDGHEITRREATERPPDRQNPQLIIQPTSHRKGPLSHRKGPLSHALGR